MSFDPNNLQICLVGNPILRHKSEPVIFFGPQLENCGMRMLDLKRCERGLGLSGPQVGILNRIIVVGGNLYINPEIETWEGTQINNESCLSIPGKRIEVRRAKRVEGVYQDSGGIKHKFKGAGLIAACFQHEVDHLDGILFTDYELDDNIVIAGLKERPFSIQSAPPC